MKAHSMTDNQKHIQQLFTAELQFRLASAVSLATTMKVQPLDLPTEWVHGKHTVKYEEIALREDQADYASWFLQGSAAFLMAASMRNAIRDLVDNPKASTDPDIRAAYQIARIIRNAFAHSPFSPIWHIDVDCQGKVFEIVDVICLDTTDLNGKTFEWHHCGGPLALFRLCRFVRKEILGDDTMRKQLIPGPTRVIQQQGDLLLIEIEKIPDGAVQIEPEPLPDGGVVLHRGSDGDYIIYPSEKE